MTKILWVFVWLLLTAKVSEAAAFDSSKQIHKGYTLKSISMMAY
jgi:hypothetical protein